MPRELTDDALLHQLEVFLSYRERGGSLGLIGWARTKHFTLDDRRFLEGAFMGAELAKRRAS